MTFLLPPRVFRSQRLQWLLTRQSNGRYHIQNIGSQLYADPDSHARPGEAVYARRCRPNQLWTLRETEYPGVFVLATTSSRRYWELGNDEIDTEVSLSRFNEFQVLGMAYLHDQSGDALGQGS
jgi:hypothetical protein